MGSFLFSHSSVKFLSHQTQSMSISISEIDPKHHVVEWDEPFNLASLFGPTLYAESTYKNKFSWGAWAAHQLSL